MLWDAQTPFGMRIEQRLRDEAVIWLVTTAADGTPQPSPVWFLYADEGLLIYSKPNTPKLRNIAARPTVALHFNTDVDGDNVIIFHGRAMIDPAAPAATAVPAYHHKYADGIVHIGMTPDSFAATYNTAIRVHLEKVRGW